MTSTPALLESTGKEADVHSGARRSISVGVGVLWIVGAAAAWNIGLVLFHDLMTRLLR